MGCCTCTGVCNHVGPHAYCWAHAPNRVEPSTWYDSTFQPSWTTTTLDPRPARYDRVEKKDPGRMERLWRRIGRRFGWL